MQNSTKVKLKKMLFAILIFIAIIVFSGLAFVSISYITTPLDVDALSSTSLGIKIYNDSNINTTSV